MPIVNEFADIAARLRELQFQKAMQRATINEPVVPELQFDFADGAHFRHMLIWPVTRLLPIANSVPGLQCTILIQQDGVGGRKLEYDPAYRFPAGKPPTLDMGKFCPTGLAALIGSNGEIFLR